MDNFSTAARPRSRGASWSIISPPFNETRISLWRRLDFKEMKVAIVG
jgi:hypothetical protein